MTTPSNNSHMHNDIMAAGSKKRPPMLALGPYEMNLIQLPNTPSDNDNPGQPNEIVKETYGDTTPHNQKLIDAKAEAVHMILNGIGNDIYSTMDACLNAKEMCIDIERNKGKEIAKPITPPSKSASEEDSDLKQAQRDKQIKKSLALIAKHFKKPTNNNLITTSNTMNKNVYSTPRTGNQVVQQSGIQCFNCKGLGHFAKECIKPKGAKDYKYYKEKMMLCKQESKGILLSAKQSEWLQDTNEEPDEQEQEAHYMYMAKIQEFLHVTDDNSGPTYDVEPLKKV
nr:hypothetical protein [Tanacetum cinerariifolium]